jgi:hypothetical protein
MLSLVSVSCSSSQPATAPPPPLSYVLHVERRIQRGQWISPIRQVGHETGGNGWGNHELETYTIERRTRTCKTAI